MDSAVLLTCLVIVLARVTDITLDTVRTVFIVQGRRKWAAILGFFEALIFILVVAKVLQNFSNPAYAVAYAAGFAGGTYLGITVEGWLGLGYQVVAVFTHKGQELAAVIRARGFRVTALDAEGREGPINVLYIHVRRKQTEGLLKLAREEDANCYCVVNDSRSASRNAGEQGAATQPAGKER